MHATLQIAAIGLNLFGVALCLQLARRAVMARNQAKEYDRRATAAAVRCKAEADRAEAAYKAIQRIRRESGSDQA